MNSTTDTAIIGQYTITPMGLGSEFGAIRRNGSDEIVAYARMWEGETLAETLADWVQEFGA